MPSASTSSATRASMGWSSGEIRGHGRGGLHRLAPRRGSCWRTGTRSSPSTRSPTTTSAGGRSGTRAPSTCSSSISPTRRSSRSSRARTASSISPASRECGRAAASASASTFAATSSRPSGVFEAAAGGRRPRRLRVVVLVYGDAERYPTAEDVAAAADLALRDHEARVRAARTRHRPRAWPRRRPAPLLQRLRAAAAPDMAFPPCSRRSPDGARFTALRRRRAAAASRTSATRRGEDRWRWSGPRRRGLQRRRRRGGDDERGDRAARARSPDAASTSSARAAVAGRRSGGRRPTRRSRRRARLVAADRVGRRACGRSGSGRR